MAVMVSTPSILALLTLWLGAANTPSTQPRERDTSLSLLEEIDTPPTLASEDFRVDVHRRFHRCGCFCGQLGKLGESCP